MEIMDETVVVAVAVEPGREEEEVEKVGAQVNRERFGGEDAEKKTNCLKLSNSKDPSEFR
ncbi:hypothetical protein E2C01_087650 [Portunus trituberculatus]|uniref:Uncharacterized protein n=1 Tax=Portunus trituberculatus TaxID=210409 RepID=A0A5B7JD22_PORTR|nr:hypothetical protein [Portunus trituberculatus]